MKYLFNPATDEFEPLTPTLRDRFDLKDQMADAASATQMAIDESLKAFKVYQNSGGTMSYKDFIASGSEGVSKFFKDGGRVNFDKGSPFPITDEVLKQIDNLIKNTNLNLKEIGKQIGYGTEKRGMTIDTPVMKRYIEKYARPSDARLQTRGVPLSPEKGIGKEIVTAYDKRVKQFGPGKYISQIVREVYGPGVKDFDSARAQVRKLLEEERGYKGKVNIPIDKKDLTAEQIKTKARVKKLKLIDNETIRKFMAGPEGSKLQYHHSDATKTSPVTLRNVIYVPSDVNNYIQKYEGPITQRKKEIEKLIKNKPDGYKKQIDIKLKQIRNTIAKANIDLDKAGYSAFKNIIEVDTVDPFGKKIKIGGNTALKIGSDLAVEIGLDPDKPLKQYTSEEKIKLVKAKEALLDVSKRNIPDLSKVKPELDLKPISRGSNVKAKITEFRNTAQNVVNKIPFKGLRMVPAAGAAAIDFGVFAGLLGTPIDEAIVGASGWLTKRPELGKALGTIATQYSEGKINLSELRQKSLPILKEIAKEQLPESKLPPVAEEINDKMGEGTIKIADDVPEPESAGRRRMFEEANERFGNIDEMEISDIDNPFMAAMGGRVGFQDGTSNPTFDQIKAALENTDLIKNLEEENKQTLEEQIIGEDGDRNIIQTLNTMLDPRAYPYYAQELVSGASNIPELAFRFPFAVTGLVSDVATGRGNKLKRAIETLDPKLTKAIKEKIGFTDMLEKSRTERTGPQKTTGGILELGAEIPGPATPYFLIKAFPKVVNQIKNLVGSKAAARKVNEEIEKRLAGENVDQTRRDLLLAAGAGGAVAVLKFLGLDNLIKTTKVTKAVPEIVTKGGTPKYFFDFVQLIKTKGDDVTDKAATLERQKVYNYEGYQLTEDITTGKMNINKETEGGASYYVGDGEYETVDGIIRKEEINYEPPETILGKDNKPVKVPENYEENTLKPDSDGSDGDVEGGLESINDILDLLSSSGKKYNLKELTEMGINPAGLGKSKLKKILKDPTEIKFLDEDDMFKDTLNKVKYRSEKAEGGIISGVKSGPPPKSGPTPHGLPYVAKNVRPIKERK